MSRGPRQAPLHGARRNERSRRQRASPLHTPALCVRAAWVGCGGGRLALDYLAVWTGAGDIGKSMFAAWVIRGLTLGELDGEFTGEPREALIVATEDGREDVWKPRLQAAGADLDGVCFLDHPPDWNLRDGIDLLAHAIAENTSLLFIDAAMSHMPQARGSENVNSPTFVRSALAPLISLCRERHITALFGVHPPKARAGTFADAVQASGAFSQLPRLGLLFGIHPEDLALPRRRAAPRHRARQGQRRAESRRSVIAASTSVPCGSTTAHLTSSATCPTWSRAP